MSKRVIVMDNDDEYKKTVKLVDDFGEFIANHGESLQEADPFVVTQLVLLVLNAHLDMGRFPVEELDKLDSKKYAKRFESDIAFYMVQRMMDAVILDDKYREE